MVIENGCLFGGFLDYRMFFGFLDFKMFSGFLDYVIDLIILKEVYWVYLTIFTVSIF